MDVAGDVVRLLTEEGKGTVGTVAMATVAATVDMVVTSEEGKGTVGVTGHTDTALATICTLKLRPFVAAPVLRVNEWISRLHITVVLAVVLVV